MGVLVFRCVCRCVGVYRCVGVCLGVCVYACDHAFVRVCVFEWLEIGKAKIVSK